MSAVTPPAEQIQQLMQLFNQGQIPAVIAIAGAWTQQYPAYPFGWVALGTALQRSGRSEDAIVAFGHAIALAPRDAGAHNNLGNVFKSLRRFEEAEQSYRRAAEANPAFAEAHYNLALCAFERGDLAAAEAGNRRALELKPALAEAHNNLGMILDEQGRLGEAEVSCRLALQLRPDMAAAHNGLGNILKNRGNPGEAVASYRRALALNPADLAAHDNLLLCLNYAALQSPAECLQAARQFGQMIESQAGPPQSSWRCDPSPSRLRVGMVSGDLRQHPVGHFLESMLAHIDPAKIELFAYSNHASADELSACIRPYFSQWKTIHQLGDAEAAKTIHDDGVHIAIDLSGHTQHNRLPLFARRPAPLQVSWLGYFATTGVAQIDYLLTDSVATPPHDAAHFSERLWPLPDTRLCFTPPQDAPDVTPPPFVRNGHVTFGCYQNLAKVSDEVLGAWGKILAALPDARLRLQARPLGYPQEREHLAQRCAKQGLDPARMDMHGESTRTAYLASHAEVDMILDTFPFPGGTTTCEALWMGVPTLTLCGDRMLARQGASMLTAAELTGWIAGDAADYVYRAVEHARNREGLAALRAGLREQVRASPLFDAPRFAKAFEDAMWGIWSQRKINGNTN
ncbi:MAG: tetratricopeptide repeat protein [Betaproteobacteria bacterium]|nr:tetratricopeptide repeat protein [Betaproteobacteria bacterium]